MELTNGVETLTDAQIRERIREFGHRIINAQNKDEDVDVDAVLRYSMDTVINGLLAQGYYEIGGEQAFEPIWRTLYFATVAQNRNSKSK
jgi:hypothetical protein